MKPDPCQIPDCGKPATFETYPVGNVLGTPFTPRPDATGFQVCDAHLIESLSARVGDPDPEHWRVFPIHESPTPLCSLACPTCHPDDAKPSFIDVVFDGPPSHESGRFVEVENASGHSISVGEWIDRGDGLFALRIQKGSF